MGGDSPFIRQAKAILGDDDRLFKPVDVAWTVDRELVVVAAGGRALLMQLAHPKVAAGVERFSNFKADPLRRLRSTLTTMWSIGFDDKTRAMQTLRGFAEAHDRVKGSIPNEGESLPRGTAYSAWDPELLLWVHATLVDSTLLAYETFVGPLAEWQRQQYYVDNKRLALLFGIPRGILPDSLEAFDDYMAAMLKDGTIQVGPTALQLCGSIVHPTPLRLRLLGPLPCLVTTAMLPEALRHQYALAWDERQERCFRGFAALIRSTLPLVPGRLRLVPNARLAERELSRVQR